MDSWQASSGWYTGECWFTGGVWEGRGVTVTPLPWGNPFYYILFGLRGVRNTLTSQYENFQQAWTFPVKVWMVPWHTISTLRSTGRLVLFKLAFNAVWLHRKIFEPGKDTIRWCFLPPFECLWCSCCRLSLWVPPPSPRSPGSFLIFWVSKFDRTIEKLIKFTLEKNRNSKIFSIYLPKNGIFKKNTTTDHNLIGFI